MVIILVLIINVNSAQITGEIVTGKATIRKTNLSIVIDVNPPAIIINSPRNITYNVNNISFNFTAYDSMTQISSTWYSIDNIQNITITGNTTFTVSDGSHTLTLYANDSLNHLNFSSIVFFVDSNLGWNVFTKKYNGSTTNFTRIKSKGKKYMQNISNFTLEITSYGKIRFNEPINISRNINLDLYSDIAENIIYINSEQLPELNKTATLWLYNLTFSNPRILRNGEVCPSTICIKESYSGGTLKFNVTDFTNYSAEETPTASSVAPSGGGGGKVTIKKFEIDKEEVKIKLKQGETKIEEIKIKNTGNKKLSFTITSPELEEFIKISEESFELDAGKEKTIKIDFIARENTAPDLYLGFITIKADSSEKQIFVAIGVESKKPLFDVKVEIPRKFLTVLPGDELLATIIIYNLGVEGRADVVLEYSIKNESGIYMISESETRAVETGTSFVKSFQIPPDITLGKYALYVKAIYDDKTAISSTWFVVSKEYPYKKENIFLVIILIIVILIIIIYIELSKVKKFLYKKKIDEKMLVKKKIIKRR
ncbi:MAG: hypothetical protein ACTSUR_02410 [Candidatus Heimdallarchaeaceae archaeon]